MRSSRILLVSHFKKSVGKIQDPDLNDSSRPVEYDAKRIRVWRCEN